MEPTEHTENFYCTDVATLEDPFTFPFDYHFRGFRRDIDEAIRRRSLFNVKTEIVHEDRAVYTFSGPLCPFEKVDLTVHYPFEPSHKWVPLILATQFPFIGIDLNPNLARNHAMPCAVIPYMPRDS